jgi:translocation and assembly module TamB
MLDVLAIASTADITAEVRIGGTLLAPHISLSSTPSLPQDEILSRLLFNQGLGQITPAQGLELAQAAAALTGSGPDLLDSLRGKLGLDWLRFGSQGAATPGSILNPAAARPSGAAATGVSAGKYIGNGITVGVSQGLSPPTSQVTVGVQLRPHISVQTDVGSHGGTGVGLYYKYDY